MVRRKEKLDLFEESLCISRWTNEFYYQTQRVFSESGEIDVPEAIVSSKVYKKKILSEHEKYRKANEIAKQLPVLVAEVGTDSYIERLRVLNNLVEAWQNNEEVKIIKIKKQGHINKPKKLHKISRKTNKNENNDSDGDSENKDDDNEDNSEDEDDVINHNDGDINVDEDNSENKDDDEDENDVISYNDRGINDDDEDNSEDENNDEDEDDVIIYNDGGIIDKGISKNRNYVIGSGGNKSNDVNDVGKSKSDKDEDDDDQDDDDEDDDEMSRMIKYVESQSIDIENNQIMIENNQSSINSQIIFDSSGNKKEETNLITACCKQLLNQPSTSKQSFQSKKIISYKSQPNHQQENDTFQLFNNYNKEHDTKRSQLSEVIVQPAIKRKGRPRDTDNTVIGLPKKRKTSNKNNEKLFKNKPIKEQSKIILKWLLIDDKMIKNVINNKKIISASDIKVTNEKLSFAIIDDENVNLSIVSSYFTTEGWEKVCKMCKNKKSQSWECKVCSLDLDKTIDEDNDIKKTKFKTSVGCDVCLEWFHLKCAGLKKKPSSKVWICSSCRE